MNENLSNLICFKKKCKQHVLLNKTKIKDIKTYLEDCDIAVECVGQRSLDGDHATHGIYGKVELVHRVTNQAVAHVIVWRLRMDKIQNYNTVSIT